MLLVITTTITGLMAGLFFAWSVSVTPGIAKLGDREYLASFQVMNRAIVNPVFLLCFLGAAILLPVCTFMNYKQPLPDRFYFLVAASVFYIGGVIVVTFAGNIPLNNALDKFDISSATAEQMAALRSRFETKWNMLNYARTFAAVVALIFAIYACVSKSKA